MDYRTTVLVDPGKDRPYVALCSQCFDATVRAKLEASLPAGWNVIDGRAWI